MLCAVASASRIEAERPVQVLTRPAVRQAGAALIVGAALTLQRVVTPDWQTPCLLIAGVLLCGLAVYKLTGGVRRRVLAKASAQVDACLAPDTEVPTGRPRHRWAILALLAGVACLAPVAWSSGTALAILAATGLGYAVLFSPAVPAAWRSQAETLGRIGLTVTAVAAAFHLLGGQWHVDVVTAGLQLGLIASVAAATDSVRDLAADRRAGRRTVAARMGVPVGRYMITLLCLMPYTLGLCWVIAGNWSAALLPLLSAPLAAQVIRDVHMHVPGPMLAPVVERAALLHAVFAGLLVVGLVV